MSSEALERAAKESRSTYVTGTPEKYPKAELRGFTILEAEALLAEVARLEQELSLLDRNATVWHADGCGVWNANPPWRCTCDGSVLRDAFAVAREREQRARVVYETAIRDGHPGAVANKIIAAARAALVEPAADEPGETPARLAEPDTQTETSGPGGLRPSHFGSASLCSGCGWRVADCNCVRRAAADEPGETP